MADTCICISRRDFSRPHRPCCPAHKCHYFYTDRNRMANRFANNRSLFVPAGTGIDSYLVLQATPAHQCTEHSCDTESNRKAANGIVAQLYQADIDRENLRLCSRIGHSRMAYLRRNSVESHRIHQSNQSNIRKSLFDRMFQCTFHRSCNSIEDCSYRFQFHKIDH